MNYLNPFDNQEITSYTTKTFGESLRKRREQLNISLRQMAKQLNMSPVYLSDIERGNRPAPSGCVSGIDYMSKLVNALQLNSYQQKTFKIMAQFSCMSNTRFIDNYFINNPNALKFLMKAIQENWTNDQWEKIYKLISK